MWNAKNSKHPRPPGNWVEISPAGISLEAIGSLAGGYSAGYSDILGDVDVWATWASTSGENKTYAALVDVLSRMAPAFANFRLVSTCRDLPPPHAPANASNPPYRCLKNSGAPPPSPSRIARCSWLASLETFDRSIQSPVRLLL